MKKILWECKPEICSNGCKCTTGTASMPEPTSCLFKTGYQQNWIPSPHLQITEIPEPVYVLYIPEQMLEAVSSYLSNRNGLNVVIVSESDGFVTFETTRAPGETDYVSRCWVVPKSWLKQKPAEPTVDELQERLNEVLRLCEKWAPTAIINSILKAATG